VDKLEATTEKALSEIFADDARHSLTDERNEIVERLIGTSGIRPGEIIAFTKNSLDTVEKTVSLQHHYSVTGGVLKIHKLTEKRVFSVPLALMKKLSAYLSKAPHVFILSGEERDTVINTGNVDGKLGRKLLLWGEIIRKERNVSFHGFRHFFNSTIRGTVSDETLRLQTGHADAKMTDHYDHITDERGEQLRQAVKTKILPFIPTNDTV